MKPLAEELREYLADGVLTEEFVLNNIDGLLDALRRRTSPCVGSCCTASR